jgi:hypothetical protein
VPDLARAAVAASAEDLEILPPVLRDKFSAFYQGHEVITSKRIAL